MNLYAETNKPKNFYAIVVSMVVFLLVVLAIFVGMIGYLAYGDKVHSLILYNLPNDEMSSNLAKVFYVITIMGSDVLLIQPIFYLIESSQWYLDFVGDPVYQHGT